MAKYVSKKQYLSAVARKLNDPTTKQLLQFGQTWKSGVPALRDGIGYEVTKKTILTSAANQFDLSEGRVAFNQQFSNFSAGATQEDVSDIKTVGAVDLTILNMSQSLIPFICVDRALEAIDATVYYNNLVAVNSAGGVQAGDVVWGNFNPPNTNVDLDAKKSFSGTVSGTMATLDVGSNVIPKSVELKFFKNGALVGIAGDYAGPTADGTGTIFVNLLANNESVTAANLPAKASINYATGVITFTNPSTATTGITFTASATSDVVKGQSAPTDNDVLTVEPQWTSIALKSTPMNIVLNNNMMNMMYMTKVNALATGKSGNPYTDTIFQRVSNTYIEAVNNRVIRGMKASVTGVDVLADMTTYTVGGGGSYGSYAATKNDVIAQTVTNLKAAMLARCGVGVTALVANSIAVAMMETVPVLFTAAPNINNGLNGLVGYFNNIPVFRHNGLDGMTATIGGTSIANTDAVLFSVYKSADNGSGSQIYGEYIPFTSTGNVNNYFMPVQNATGFFSQVAFEVVDPRLIGLAVIKGNDSIFKNWSGK